MKLTFLVLFIALISSAFGQEVYYPGYGYDWEHKSPSELNMDESKIMEAVQLAQDIESDAPRELELTIALSFAREPYNEILGPTQERGDPAGMIIKDGYIIAEWGDTKRVDMTFSVTKSFLSTIAGVALHKGLIADLNDKVKDYVPTDHFDSEHNSKITWDHMLRQTTEWNGTLWDKPSWGDRPEGNDAWSWPTVELKEPGTKYKYSDVRVNLFAMSMTYVWRKSLAKVLHEHVMEPIGATNTWHWEGYRNSWIDINGERINSVSGGGHWGGGMFINAYDQARFGLLTLRKGKWKDEVIFPESWYNMATTPGDVNPGYGFMNWFLNTEQRSLPSAPKSAFAHRGMGANIIYCDPENDLVIVARWVRSRDFDDVVKKVLEAIE